MKKMLTLLIFIGIMFISSCASSKQVEKKDVSTIAKVASAKIKPKTNFTEPWEGYYHGVLSCSDCRGIDTWFFLQKQGEDTLFEMRERFLGQKNRYVDGVFEWIKYGKNGYLSSYENKEVSLGFGTATLKDNPSVKLKKLTPFFADDSVLLLDESSMMQGKTSGSKVVGFDGMINFSQATSYGYKSHKAKYLINCKKRTYDISRSAYYKGRYGMRGFVSLLAKAPEILHVRDNALMQQVYERYCN